MLEPDSFAGLTQQVTTAIGRRVPDGLQYAAAIPLKDAHLCGLLFAADRDDRRFQVSLRDHSGDSGAAFFKLLGLNDETRLLHVLYSEDTVDNEEAAELFAHWIVGLQTEDWLVTRFEALLGGDPVSQLIEVLERTAALLRSVGEDAWATWLGKDAAWIRAGDAYGLEHARKAFGGMGSLTDLVIHPSNGHRVKDVDVSDVNDRLQRATGRIFGLVELVLREQSKL